MGKRKEIKFRQKGGDLEGRQGIAADEIDTEALMMEFAMEDMEKEQAAIREATEQAKKFRDRLETVGLSYMDLLELEALRHGLGEMGHEIMLGYYRGEGWPSGT